MPFYSYVFQRQMKTQTRQVLDLNLVLQTFGLKLTDSDETDVQVKAYELLN